MSLRKRTTVLVLAAAFSATGLAAPARYVVTFDSDASAAEAMAEVSSRSDASWRHVRRDAVAGEVIEAPTGSEEEMRRWHGVTDVHVVRQLKTFHADPLPWHLGDGAGGVRAERAWEWSRGEGASVAVIDSGITAHTGLAGIGRGYDFVDNPTWAADGDGRDDDPGNVGEWGNPWFDNEKGDYACDREPGGMHAYSNWHGTTVAGMLTASAGADVAGIAPEVDVIPIRVTGACHNVDETDVSDAIVWASGGDVDGIPAIERRADVINISLGYHADCPPQIAAAIAGAIARGSIVVAAAGNNGSDMVAAPASCPGVIAVAALDETGELASYADRGSAVSLSAPGGRRHGKPAQQIKTTSNDSLEDVGAENYVHSVGSSLAAPLVAGVVALMRSVKPDLSAADARRLLESNARPGCGTGCGHGMLDAGATLDALAAEMN